MSTRIVQNLALVIFFICVQLYFDMVCGMRYNAACGIMRHSMKRRDYREVRLWYSVTKMFLNTVWEILICFVHACLPCTSGNNHLSLIIQRLEGNMYYGFSSSYSYQRDTNILYTDCWTLFTYKYVCVCVDVCKWMDPRGFFDDFSSYSSSANFLTAKIPSLTLDHPYLTSFRFCLF